MINLVNRVKGSTKQQRLVYSNCKKNNFETNFNCQIHKRVLSGDLGWIVAGHKWLKTAQNIFFFFDDTFQNHPYFFFLYRFKKESDAVMLRQIYGSTPLKGGAKLDEHIADTAADIVVLLLPALQIWNEDSIRMLLCRICSYV